MDLYESLGEYSEDITVFDFVLMMHNLSNRRESTDIEDKVIRELVRSYDIECLEKLLIFSREKVNTKHRMAKSTIIEIHTELVLKLCDAFGIDIVHRLYMQMPIYGQARRRLYMLMEEFKIPISQFDIDQYGYCDIEVVRKLLRRIKRFSVNIMTDVQVKSIVEIDSRYKRVLRDIYNIPDKVDKVDKIKKKSKFE